MKQMKHLKTMMLALLLGAPLGAWAEDKYTTEVYDFSGVSSQTVTLSETGTTSTSGTTVYMVASDASNILSTTRFAFGNVPSYNKGLVTTSVKRSMVSVQGLGIGDVVIVTTEANFYIRSKNVSYIGSDGSIGVISTAGASGSEADSEKINSGTEYIITSGNSFDFYSTSASQRISKITIKKLSTALSNPNATETYNFATLLPNDESASTVVEISSTKALTYSDVDYYYVSTKSGTSLNNRLAVKSDYTFKTNKGWLPAKNDVFAVCGLKAGDVVTFTTGNTFQLQQGSLTGVETGGTLTSETPYTVGADGDLVIRISGNGGSRFSSMTIAQRPAQTMTISNNYRTFSSPWAVDISGQSNFVAYYATSVDGDVVTMTKIEDGIIPANTGVMLYGESGTFYYTTTTKTIENNLLQPVLSDAQAVAASYTGKTTYVLGNKSGVGFYPTVARTGMGGKAYLLLDTPSGARPRLSLRFGDGTTGISEVSPQNDNGEGSNDNVYDLQGRRVTGQPAHGLYIVNGKKVFVK